MTVPPKGGTFTIKPYEGAGKWHDGEGQEAANTKKGCRRQWLGSHEKSIGE